MRFLALVLLTAFYFLFTASTLHAQSIDLTSTYKILTPNNVSGDIISSSAQGMKLTEVPSDPKIFGVIQDQALMVFRSQDTQEKPVSRAGVAEVNVTTFNGEIKQGDFITSSEIPGKGQKATLSGYVLGTALTDFTLNSGPQSDFKGKKIASGKLTVALRIEYAEINTTRSVNRIIEYFNQALFKNLQDPEKFIKVIRYLAGALVIIIAFSLGFFTFSKSITKGIEAIGRNPLAKRSIQFTIMLNIFLILATIVLGIIATFIILRV